MLILSIYVTVKSKTQKYMANSPRLSGPSEQMGNVISLPEFSADYGEDFERELSSFLDSVALGSLAVQQGEVRIPDSSREAVRATFVDREDFARGREEGVHGAKFGQLILNGAGLHEMPTLIAAKPFGHDVEAKPASLLTREIAMNNFLNGLSNEQLAFLPLGVWKNAENILHIISLYEHDVTTYDNVFWADRDVHPEALRQDNLMDAYRMCLSGLGYLHAIGIGHQDAEAKNLASSRKGLRFVDLETAVKLPADQEQATALTRQDIETFLDSTVQVDENRAYVQKVLDRTNIGRELARAYRNGRRAAYLDTGKRSRKLPTSTDAYFDATIAHTRTIAHTYHAAV